MPSRSNSAAREPAPAAPLIHFMPDLAEILGFGTPAGARRFAQAAGIPMVRVGRRLGVLDTELRDWLTSDAVQA